MVTSSNSQCMQKSNSGEGGGRAWWFLWYLRQIPSAQIKYVKSARYIMCIHDCLIARIKSQRLLFICINKVSWNIFFGGIERLWYLVIETLGSQKLSSIYLRSFGWNVEGVKSNFGGNGGRLFLDWYGGGGGRCCSFVYMPQTWCRLKLPIFFNVWYSQLFSGVSR